MSTDELPEDGPAYELVMPFVVCESNGGPLDDHAFVLGCQFEDLRQRLDARPSVVEEFVDADLIPQLDLLAMKGEWDFFYSPAEHDPDHSQFVTFQTPGFTERRGSPEDPS